MQRKCSEVFFAFILSLLVDVDIVLYTDRAVRNLAQTEGYEMLLYVVFGVLEFIVVRMIWRLAEDWVLRLERMQLEMMESTTTKAFSRWMRSELYVVTVMPLGHDSQEGELLPEHKEQMKMVWSHCLIKKRKSWFMPVDGSGIFCVLASCFIKVQIYLRVYPVNGYLGMDL